LSGKGATEPRRALWKTWTAAFRSERFLGHGAAKGNSAHCGERPETLSLDSAAFEKAGETFLCASLGDSAHCGERPGTLPLDPAAFRERRAKAFAALRAVKGGKFMRLDKYLKVSRLIKRRTVANEACDNGLVTVNGKPARASYEVKVGDQISLRFGARSLTVEVVSVQETVKQSDAATLYREVSQ